MVSRKRRVARGPRILVLEDDRMVAAVLMRALEDMGVSPECAAEGSAAVERWRGAMASDRPFQAAILDLGLADGMPGVEALRRLKELDPGARVIVTSGDPSDPAVSDYLAHGFCGVLPKPFTVGDISAALGAALSCPAPARRRPR